MQEREEGSEEVIEKMEEDRRGEAKRGYNRLCERKRRKEGIGGRRW